MNSTGPEQRVLIIGSGGLIGQHLHRELQNRGILAYGCSRTALPLARHFVVRSNEEIEKLLLSLSWDVVFDLRAMAVSDVRELSRGICNSKKWVNISSIYAYGNPKYCPDGIALLSELSEIRRGSLLCAYGRNKLEIEEFLYLLRPESKHEYVSVRVPFVIGKGDRTGRVRNLIYVSAHGASSFEGSGTYEVSIIGADRLAVALSNLVTIETGSGMLLNLDEDIKLRWIDHFSMVEKIVGNRWEKLRIWRAASSSVPFLFAVPFSMANTRMRNSIGPIHGQPDWCQIWRDAVDWELLILRQG